MLFAAFLPKLSKLAKLSCVVDFDEERFEFDGERPRRGAVVLDAVVDRWAKLALALEYGAVGGFWPRGSRGFEFEFEVPELNERPARSSMAGLSCPQ